jgi:hypothetical protein
MNRRRDDLYPIRQASSDCRRLGRNLSGIPFESKNVGNPTIHWEFRSRWKRAKDPLAYIGLGCADQDVVFSGTVRECHPSIYSNCYLDVDGSLNSIDARFRRVFRMPYRHDDRLPTTPKTEEHHKDKATPFPLSIKTTGKQFAHKLEPVYCLGAIFLNQLIVPLFDFRRSGIILQRACCVSQFV